MAISRRQILAGLAAAAVAGAQQQPSRPPSSPPAGWPARPSSPHPAQSPRTSPAVCLYSQLLIKVEYEAVGMVLRDLGFDGADLAVVPGSHVAPEQANSDLMRAIEAVSGVGLEVPIISTSVVNGNDPYGRQILGIAGFMGIGLFRPGYWKYRRRARSRHAARRSAARSARARLYRARLQRRHGLS